MQASKGSGQVVDDTLRHRTVYLGEAFEQIHATGITLLMGGIILATHTSTA